MKYEYALYYENDQWKKVIPKELYSTDLRAKLRGRELCDKTKRFRLYVRFRKDCPHFYSRGILRENFSTGKDTEEHNNLITTLLNYLNSKPRIKLCHYSWDYYPQKKQEIIDFAEFDNYLWNSEVKNAISTNGYVVSDIMGQSTKPGLTARNPIIAIEVVHTHFLSMEAFDSYREISSILPYIVVIYFVHKGGMYNNMKNSNRSSDMGRLRISCYIQDGSFWIGEERFEEKYPDLKECNLNNSKDYYNAVVEHEIKYRMGNDTSKKQSQK